MEELKTPAATPDQISTERSDAIRKERSDAIRSKTLSLASTIMARTRGVDDVSAAQIVGGALAAFLDNRTAAHPDLAKRIYVAAVVRFMNQVYEELQHGRDLEAARQRQAADPV